MPILTLRDILRANYDDFAQQLEAELQPVGLMEICAAAQVIQDQARMLRYNREPDADNPDLDKARHRNALNQRIAMKELRQLQADRFLKVQLELDLPGVASVKDIHRFLNKERPKSAPVTTPTDAIASVESKIASLLNNEMEKEHKRSQFPPLAGAALDLSPQTESVGQGHRPMASGGRRNWPCPCGSGQKYKRCCAVGNAKQAA